MSVGKQIAGGAALVGATLFGAEAADGLVTPVAAEVWASDAEHGEAVLRLCFPEDGVFKDEADAGCPDDVADLLDLPDAVTDQDVIDEDRETLKQRVISETMSARESDEAARNDIARKVKIGGGAVGAAVFLGAYGFIELLVKSNGRWDERSDLRMELLELTSRKRVGEELTPDEQDRMYELNAFFLAPGKEQWPKWSEERKEARQARKADGHGPRFIKRKTPEPGWDKNNTNEVIPSDHNASVTPSYELVGRPSASFSNLLERITGQYSADERRHDDVH